MDDVGMIELRKKLRAWKPWAEDLLDYYLKDKKRSCTAEMARKYNVSAQKVREL